MQAGIYGGKPSIDWYKDELRRTVENLHNHIFKYKRDEDGQFVFTLSEGKLAREFGLTTDRISGKRLQEVLQLCSEDIMTMYEKAYEGHVLEYESAMGERIFTTTLSPIVEQGRVVEVVGSSTDITERKRMERELQEAEELYRSLVEDTLVGVYIAYVNEHSFVYVNPRMAEMFGYTQEDMMRLGAVDLVVPEEREIVLKNQSRRCKGDRSPIRYQFHGLRSDGSIVHLEVLQKTTSYKGKPAVIGILQDITERKRAEEMVRKSELLSVIGQLAAGVAHEIRNPLTSLKGFLQLMYSQQQEKQQYFHIMVSELNRIEKIISEFLVLAKPQDIAFKERDVVPMLEHIIVLAETHAVMHNVRIVTRYEPDPPSVMCEENQLKQVFLNLLKNAIEAMPNGGEVHVGVRREGDTVVISFRDQGCGIPEDRLARLGEPFYTTKENGTGLGLMVSYRIIHNHGGTISVTSREQQGSTFEVRLPVG